MTHRDVLNNEEGDHEERCTSEEAHVNPRWE